MKKSDKVFIAKYDQLSQTSNEDSWIKKFDEFMFELEKYKQSKKK